MGLSASAEFAEDSRLGQRSLIDRDIYSGRGQLVKVDDFTLNVLAR